MRSANRAGLQSVPLSAQIANCEVRRTSRGLIEENPMKAASLDWGVGEKPPWPPAYDLDETVDCN
jgi:hypothetical protein